MSHLLTRNTKNTGFILLLMWFALAEAQDGVLIGSTTKTLNITIDKPITSVEVILLESINNLNEVTITSYNQLHHEFITFSILKGKQYDRSHKSNKRI